jgi:hypothetical protein
MTTSSRWSAQRDAALYRACRVSLGMAIPPVTLTTVGSRAGVTDHVDPSQDASGCRPTSTRLELQFQAFREYGAPTNASVPDRL